MYAQTCERVSARAYAYVMRVGSASHLQHPASQLAVEVIDTARVHLWRQYTISKVFSTSFHKMSYMHLWRH
jgi:hypothetical protein